MLKVKVSNMKSPNGNDVPNQFVIQTGEGAYFQSYNTIIAFRPFFGGAVLLDKDAWDYSKTTGKYRNIFLNETKKETEARIKDGTYLLVDLN